MPCGETISVPLTCHHPQQLSVPLPNTANRAQAPRAQVPESSVTRMLVHTLVRACYCSCPAQSPPSSVLSACLQSPLASLGWAGVQNRAKHAGVLVP